MGKLNQGEIKVPDHLYHYTSLEGLAHILKDQRILFNRLDRMDDALESKSADFETIGKFCFVSSWTADEQENIPLWKMYTGDMHGVRIKIPANPFDFYQLKEEKKVLRGPLKSLTDNSTIFPINPLEYGQFSFRISFDQKEFLFQVVYEDLKTYGFPQYLTPESQGIGYRYARLGSTKVDSWQFQNEWRYVIRLFPRALFYDVSVGSIEEILTIFRKAIEEEGVPHDHVFMDLNKAAFKNIEILTGPKMTPGERILLNSLVREHCPTATVSDSQLTGHIQDRKAGTP